MNNTVKKSRLLESLDVDLSEFEPHFSILRNAIKTHFGIRSMLLTGGSFLSDFKMYDFYADEILAFRARDRFKRLCRRKYRQVIGRISEDVGVNISHNDTGILKILQIMQAQAITSAGKNSHESL